MEIEKYVSFGFYGSVSNSSELERLLARRLASTRVRERETARCHAWDRNNLAFDDSSAHDSVWT